MDGKCVHLWCILARRGEGGGEREEKEERGGEGEREGEMEEKERKMGKWKREGEMNGIGRNTERQ